ncbi:hypothetical protein AB0M43_14475 [Longispora sp. NPDC051575]|uniref:hypothetical protein n=1 Tax=Longispora sp. NPDC051575 TaxID=3154943 RepID=UPI00342901E2
MTTSNPATLVVVVPDEVPAAVLASATTLSRYLGISGTFVPQFWTKASPWQRHHLVDPRRCGKQKVAAGGQLRYLDLAGMRHAVAMSASIRHHQWLEVTKGTKHATPWHVWLGKHTADPAKNPLKRVKAEYQAQPRVLAMAAHNAGFGPVFATADLEAFQAGSHAYATYCALRAVCGEALITADGTRLAADGPEMAKHIAYLGEAHAHLESLDRRQRIVAITT